MLSSTERAEIEAAITLLQRAGYAIFKKEAELVLTAQTIVRPEQIGSCGYESYVKTEHARVLGQELQRSGGIDSRYLKPSRHLSLFGPWPHEFSQPFRSSARLWLGSRKEWSRI